jgi:hypothetical protein
MASVTTTLRSFRRATTSSTERPALGYHTRSIWAPRLARRCRVQPNRRFPHRAVLEAHELRLAGVRLQSHRRLPERAELLSSRAAFADGRPQARARAARCRQDGNEAQAGPANQNHRAPRKGGARKGLESGAGDRIRTSDILLGKQTPGLQAAAREGPGAIGLRRKEWPLCACRSLVAQLVGIIAEMRTRPPAAPRGTDALVVGVRTSMNGRHCVWDGASRGRPNLEGGRA